MSNVAENRLFYVCSNCVYKSSNKYDFKKHCNTIKHQKAILAMEKSQKSPKLKQCGSIEIILDCGYILKCNKY